MTQPLTSATIITQQEIKMATKKTLTKQQIQVLNILRGVDGKNTEHLQNFLNILIQAETYRRTHNIVIGSEELHKVILKVLNGIDNTQ